MLPWKFVMIHPKIFWEHGRKKKTTQAILRASQGGAGVHEIKWSLDKATNIHSVSEMHGARSSVDDELMMLQDLESSVLLELCLADIMLTFLIFQSLLQPTLMWEGCSLGWKGTRTKLDGPFSQYSFHYVWHCWLSRHFSPSTSFPLALFTYQVLINLKIRLPCEN